MRAARFRGRGVDYVGRFIRCCLVNMRAIFDAPKADVGARRHADVARWRRNATMRARCDDIRPHDATAARALSAD